MAGVRVGAFNSGTAAAGNTVAVSGLGFQPKAVIFWWSGATGTVDAAAANHHRGFGFGVSSTDRRAAASSSEDAAAASNTSRYHTDAAVVAVANFAGSATEGLLDVQSMDSDGFTLVVDEQFTLDIRIHYFAVGGSSITNTQTGSFLEPAVTGEQATTGVGFQPSVLFFLGDGDTVAPPNITTQGRLLFGAAVSSTQEGALNGAANDAADPTVTGSYCLRGECVVRTTPALTQARAGLVSMDTDGFTLDWVERGFTGVYYHYLAIRGGSWLLGDLLTQTDTTTDIAESGFGFAPDAAIFLSHANTQSTADTTQADDALSIGAFSAVTERGAQATFDQNALADSDVASRVEHDEVYANIDAAGTVVGLMDIKSLDADGFTCIMDDADPAQKFVWYVATNLTAVLVTPGTASLTLTTFAPTVLTPRLVTPGTASLVLTTFAPTVSTPVLVTPGTASLTLAAFAPTVTATQITPPEPYPMGPRVDLDPLDLVYPHGVRKER